MPRIALILVLAWAYAGCAGRGTGPDVHPDPPLNPGPLRWTVADDRLAARVERAVTARPLVGTDAATAALATARDSADDDDRRCRVYRFRDATGDEVAGIPDDEEPFATPGAVARQWNTALAAGQTDVVWLLAALDGAGRVVRGLDAEASGLTVDQDSLQLCSNEKVSDLDRRLAHPALWFTPDPPTPGAKPGALQPLIRVDGEAGLLAQLGEVDLAIAWGTEAKRLQEATEERRVERVPRWDRTYLLWLDPAKRWINDPRFRRWLAGQIDRQAIVDYVFSGQGEPTARILEPNLVPLWEPIVDRPVSRSAEPRLSLHFDRDDAAASRIAGRVQEALRPHRVHVTLHPGSAEDLARNLRDGSVESAILSHQPALEDPILALRETLARLGPRAQPAQSILDQAAGQSGAATRRASADAAERVLLQDGDVVPIVRLHAWLSRDPRLSGVVPRGPGVLDLRQAGWLP